MAGVLTHKINAVRSLQAMVRELGFDAVIEQLHAEATSLALGALTRAQHSGSAFEIADAVNWARLVFALGNALEASR